MTVLQQTISQKPSNLGDRDPFVTGSGSAIWLIQPGGSQQLGTYTQEALSLQISQPVRAIARFDLPAV